MRVSAYDKFKVTQNYISDIQYQTQKKQEQIATGKIFNKVSDDPVRVNRSMIIASTESRVSQYQDNISDAKSMLEYIDTVYENTTSNLQEAQKIAIKGANDTYSSADRGVMADNIEETIKQIVGFANSQHLDRYMFSGQKLDTKPIDYDGTSFTYNGNNRDMVINASEEVEVKVSQSAEDVFVPVLNQLVKLRDALRSDDQSQIETAMNDLNTATNDFIDNRSKVGVQLQSMDLLSEAYSQTKTDLTVKKQETESVDMAAAITDFTYLQTIYQATVKSSLNMLKNSILDYI
ncbi:flagellar hook-associated protein FlgL [Bacillus mexicanus]|uniref:flagellar hook-associated protein FlgL n=1 Tax=Bacillus mexicanus TaxID=2834415 RepID=UPI003D232564